MASNGSTNVGGGSNVGSGQTKGAPAAPAKPRRKRRLRFWLIVCGSFVGLLLVLAALGPSLISTSAGARLVKSLVNARIHGKIDLASLDVSWGGPTSIDSLKVSDPSGREVLQVARITYSGGAWQAIWDALAFRQIQVQSPHVVLYMDEQGRPSIIDAFKLIHPSPPSKSRPFAQIQSGQPAKKFAVQGGLVRVVTPDGLSREITQLDVDVEIQPSLESSATVKFVTPDGAKLTTQANIAGLIGPEDQLQTEQATIKGSLHSDRPLDVEGLLRLIGSRQQLAGKLQLDGTADVTKGGGKIEFKSKVSDLAAAQMTGAKPITASLAGTMNFSKQEIRGDLVLEGDAVHMKCNLKYPLNEDVKTNPSYVSALLTGHQVALPNFDVTGSAELDLPRVQQALGTVAAFRKDLTLTSGKLTFDELHAYGGKAPGFKSALHVRDVAGTQGQRAISVEPVDGTVDLAFEEGVGLRVTKDKTKITSAFCTLDGSGTPKDMDVVCKVDLDKLLAQLREVFDVGDTVLAGHLDATFNMDRDEAGDIGVKSDFTGTSLRVGSGKNVLELASVSVKQQGKAKIVNGKFQRYDLASKRLQIGDDIVATASGWYDDEKKAMHWTAVLERGSLARAGELAAGFGVDALKRFQGQATARFDVDQTSDKSPLKAAGKFTLTGLLVDGKPLEAAKGPVVCTFEDADLSPDRKSFHLKSFSASGDAFKAGVTALAFQLGSASQLTGSYTVNADIQPLAAACSRLGKTDLGDISGKLQGSGDFSTDKSLVQAKGKWTIDGLAFTQNKKVIRPDHLELNYGGTLDPSAHKMENIDVALTSNLLKAGLTGSVGDYDKQCLLNLKVNYHGSWEQIMPIIHQLAPATDGVIDLFGQGLPADEFAITGPANDPTRTPAFAGLKAAPKILWAKADCYGIAMDKADLRPSLADGKITMPVTAIPGTSGGQVNVGGTVDMTSKVYVLSIPGKVMVLDNLAINPKVGQYILSRINPIFAKTTQLEGKITLTTEDLVLPLGQDIKKQGRGRGHLDLSQMKIGPSGFMGELMKLRGLAQVGPVLMKVTGCDFEIANGRIKYDNFNIVMGEVFDMRFRGSVGFDDSLEMWVSFPIGADLLRRLKVSGPVDQIAKVLGTQRIEIPITGTRTMPVMDMSKLDIRPLIEKALKDLAKPPKLPNILGSLDPAKPKDSDKSASSQPAPKGGVLSDVMKALDPKKDTRTPGTK